MERGTSSYGNWFRWKWSVSDSLQPQRLYSPWNSPGQNTGVGSLSLLKGWWSNFFSPLLLYLFPPSLSLFSSLSPSLPPFLPYSLPPKNLSQKKLYSQVQYVKQMKMELLMCNVRAETSLISPPQYSQYDIWGISKKLHSPATRNKFTSPLELDSFQDLTQNQEKKNHFLLEMKTPRSIRVKQLVQSHTESARTRARTQPEFSAPSATQK